jgi:hypothetical protein
MSTWLWVNIPLCALFFGATAGIPLWMVLRRPDTGRSGPAAVARPHPAGARSPRRPQARPAH